MRRKATKKPHAGLYTPELEHDACGIGFIANISGSKTNQVLTDALTMLENMEHRGGKGSSPRTGDGAGILFQIPHDFFSDEATRLGFCLPQGGKYGVGMVFFPRNKKMMSACREVLEQRSGPKPLLIGVTVLTSMEREDLAGIGLDIEPQEQVLRLAALAPRFVRP